MRESSLIFKPKTLVLIVILLLILFFILGVRYGQKVEKANKVIDFILSITPTPKPTNTPTPTPLIFEDYKSKRWGLRFKYPKNFEIKESTNSPEILIAPKEASQ
jgi:ABC-type Fe3+-siderophore transport system permease subunit